MTHATPFPPFRRWLAARSDGFLAELLRRRPDALSPPPRSSDALAGRLQLRSSVQRALADVDALGLGLLEAAIDLGGDVEPVAASAVIDELRDDLAAVGVPARQRPTIAHAREALDELRQSALIHGDGPGGAGAFSGKSTRKFSGEWEDHLLVADEVVAALPAGWRLIPRPGEPTTAEVRAALSATDERQRKLLDTLADAGGLGTTRDAAEDADPSLPVPRLIAAGLLERMDDSTVRLPGRVRALMRGSVPPDGPPALRPGPAESVELRDADGVAAGAALELLRLVRALLELLGDRAAPTLKDGTIGVREHRRLVEALGVGDLELARIVAMASAAGLIHVGTPRPLPEDDSGGDYLAPTAVADSFLEETAARRWARLITGWLASEEAPWLIGAEGPTGKPLALLSPDARRAGAPELRMRVLRLLCDGTEPGFGIPDVRARFLARAPIASSHCPDDVLEQILAEFAVLGLAVPVGGGAGSAIGAGASSAGRAAAGDLGELHDGGDLADALASSLPAPATRFIVQADLTILVPGPAEGAFLETLESFTDLESSGVASVHRISEESVRRALDTGTSAADLHAFLSDRSLGEVPQSVTYLIDDVARRHGRLRGGPAAAYLRCEDPALLARVLADPVAERLGLRRLAETVAIAQVDPATMIGALRDAGLSAIAEDPLGAALDLRPERFRVPEAPRRPAAPTRADDGRISQALQSIQAGDRAADTGGGTRIDMDDDPATGAAAQALLHRAARSGLDVTIGFVDRNGRAGRRRVRPVTVSGGQVDAVDPATGQVLRFLLHRVTEVVLDA
ncbi:helicase-associated domain-containing protein [Corynebacterium freneyi]|uniref:Helicase XPB/Ssl2 N-terminal domain-containing protein n=1 Tax=Corynebacterium freneyi DNF00450 TaxID=1287475 RepID=A0A095Z8H4_9CORY|nr:helicase-associated domain-containing protein [Corynebacterium freneyi]KGF15052.1 hypothetical protein HMPREF1650_12445 [Corynebacterium freneyi DNF00450]